jgi:AAA+ ATPase superfamily predicted ATPase
MAILYDDGFFAELDDNRTLVITGRLSSGKTLLAMELAERKLRKGYKLISQTSCVWNDSIEDVVPDESGRYKFVAIIDEGGLYFRTQKSASAVSSFAAKIDSYVIFSGKKLPHADLCTLTCQVWFDFMKWFLLPFKIWRYDVYNGNKAYNGYFLQTGWWHYFGIYDTLDPGDNPEIIVDFFKKATSEFFARYGRKYQISDVEKQGSDDQAEFTNEFAGSVRSLQAAASAISKFKAGRGR